MLIIIGIGGGSGGGGGVRIGVGVVAASTDGIVLVFDFTKGSADSSTQVFELAQDVRARGERELFPPSRWPDPRRLPPIHDQKC